MKSIGEIKKEAKGLIKGNVINLFFTIILISLIFSVIGFIIEFIFGICGIETNVVADTLEIMNQSINVTRRTLAGNILDIVNSILSTIASFAIIHYLLNTVRKNEVNISDSISFVKDHFLTIIAVSILTNIFVILGLICFIIPGIIISLGLSMSQIILIDNPNLTTMEVIKKSWKMMDGHKGNYFLFTLSFIGWALLCVFIIPIVYLVPYAMVAEVIYYEELKKIN